MQILEKDPLQPNGPPQTSLIEIGPRFVLTPIRIFEGAFSGATVFSNPGEHPLPFVPRMAMLRVLYMLALSRYTFLRFFDIVLRSLPLSPTDTSPLEFVSPASVRAAIRREKGDKYRNRKDAEVEQARRKESHKRGEDELAVSKVFA